MTYQQQELSVQTTLAHPNKLHTSQELALTIAQGADDKKAEDILLLNVAEVSYLADYFVIITGFSRTQVRAIYNAIEAKVEETYGKLPLRIEGQSESRWILMDYGDVIVHIMLPQEREFYKIEAFWGHAEHIWFEA
jgi:ribosome-associated protein